MSTLTADTVAALSGPDWLRARRTSAFERFQEMGLPTEAEESWRYSRIGELDLDAWAPLRATAAAGDTTVPAPLRPVLDAVGERAGLLLVRNGRVVHSELDDELAGRGVVVADGLTLPGADEAIGGVAGPSADDAFTLLHDALLQGVAQVRVPRGVVVEQPLVVLHWLDDEAEGAFVTPRTHVQAGEGSQLTVVEWVASSDITALVDPVLELDVGDAAVVRHLTVQALGPRVWQLGFAASRVGRDASLESITAALGGDYARLRTDASLPGRGGTSALMAAYFGTQGQMYDFRTLQDHSAAKTTSDLLFKGAVGENARSVYTGLIRVEKGASGTNAYQTNRNLVLSRSAHADSVPNLEIEENDVRCSHASAVGPVDEEHRYYLESRGIPPEVADRLIVLGFFDEILERTPVAGLRPVLRWAMAEKLDRAAAANPDGLVLSEPGGGVPVPTGGQGLPDEHLPDQHLLDAANDRPAGGG